MNNITRIRDLVAQVQYKDWRFNLEMREGGALLQILFIAPDVHTGEPALQHCRKWYISTHSTDNEVIRTCYLAVQTAEAHELAENFQFKGVRVANPHLDIASLGQFLAENPEHIWNRDDQRPSPPTLSVEQAADTARNAPNGRTFFAGGEDAASKSEPQQSGRKYTPYQWGLTLRSSQQHDELVRLIGEHGWRCSAALSEEGGYDASVPHVFWENNHCKLWRGRFDGLPQISLAELPAKMAELAEAIGHAV